MKVTVTKKAFYRGVRREPGTQLTVPDQTKGAWFEVVQEQNESKAGSNGGRNKPSAQKTTDDKQANDLV